jgi:hypothetical protein
MSKHTSYSSRDGRLTGKTVTDTHSNGSKTIANYKATGSGLSRTIMGPNWSRTATTNVDSKGNSRTTTSKKSSWW